MFISNVIEGQEVQIGDRKLTVLNSVLPGVIEVLVDGEPDPIKLSWDRKTELFPDVFVTLDRTPTLQSKLKLLFEAPRSVRIREIPLKKS